MLFKGATLAQLWPPKVWKADVLVWDGRVARVEEEIAAESDEQVVNLWGRILMPGLVNGHTHLYSALATGMPAPTRDPATFQEILQEIWWKLDQALDDGTVQASGLAGSLDALRCGATGMIDHHASPNFIHGSLDVLAASIMPSGMRACLCYEATDRHGEKDGLLGVEESRRFAFHSADQMDKFSGLIGLHACMTCGPATMRAAAQAVGDAGVAAHIHVAEDYCDRDVTNARHRRHLVDYLLETGIAHPDTILAHCVHLSADEIAELVEAGCWFAHQSRSNQNNHVGHAKHLGAIPPERLLLGTDGIGNDMFAETQAAYFKSRDAGTGLTPESVLQALHNNARYLGKSLNEPDLGTFEAGALADFVALDYKPSTPLTSANLAWHFVFQMGSRHVESAWVGGKRVLFERKSAHQSDNPYYHLNLQAEAERLFAAIRALA